MITKYCPICRSVEIAIRRRSCPECAAAQSYVRHQARGLSRRERRDLQPDPRSTYAISAAQAAARRTTPAT